MEPGSQHTPHITASIFPQAQEHVHASVARPEKLVGPRQWYAGGCWCSGKGHPTAHTRITGDGGDGGGVGV